MPTALAAVSNIVLEDLGETVLGDDGVYRCVDESKVNVQAVLAAVTAELSAFEARYEAGSEGTSGSEDPWSIVPAGPSTNPPGFPRQPDTA